MILLDSLALVVALVVSYVLVALVAVDVVVAVAVVADVADVVVDSKYEEVVPANIGRDFSL